MDLSALGMICIIGDSIVYAHTDPLDAPPGRLYAIEGARVGARQPEPAQRAIAPGQHELEVLVKVGKGNAPGLYETLEALPTLRPRAKQAGRIMRAMS